MLKYRHFRGIILFEDYFKNVYKKFIYVFGFNYKGVVIMETAEYLDKLLLRYSGSFDIYQPYLINGKEYPAYGYFFSCVEKFILIREMNMWTTKSYEHILFMEAETCTEELLAEAADIIQNYMEPVLVRKNEKWPEPNHMYSYLNIVILCNKSVDHQLEKKIRHFHFEKGYKFNIRGFSKGSIMCVSMEDRKYISNYQGRSKKELFKKVFSDVEEGKPGFAQIMKENGLTPFKQQETQQ